MNLPELCIRRPVMTTLMTAALCLFGVMAYRLLPVSDLPTVDFPTIVVNASLPGATPETMASAVAKVLEAQFSTIAGIDSMTSTSGTGSTQITLTFNLERDIDAAAGEQARVKPHAQRVFLRAVDLDLRHAVDGRDALAHHRVGVFVDDRQRQGGRGEADEKDRLVRRIGLPV